MAEKKERLERLRKLESRIVVCVDMFGEEEDSNKVIFIHSKQKTQLRKDPDFLSADKFYMTVKIERTGFPVVDQCGAGKGNAVHQFFSRVGNTRSSCICYYCYTFALHKLTN